MVKRDCGEVKLQRRFGLDRVTLTHDEELLEIRDHDRIDQCGASAFSSATFFSKAASTI